MFFEVAPFTTFDEKSLAWLTRPEAKDCLVKYQSAPPSLDTYAA